MFPTLLNNWYNRYNLFLHCWLHIFKVVCCMWERVKNLQTNILNSTDPTALSWKLQSGLHSLTFLYKAYLHIYNSEFQEYNKFLSANISDLMVYTVIHTVSVCAKNKNPLLIMSHFTFCHNVLNVVCHRGVKKCLNVGEGCENRFLVTTVCRQTLDM